MQSLKDFFRSGRFLIILLSGFSSGLPLILLGGTFKLWLKNSGIDIQTIGTITAVGLPYTLKFLWAPLLDRYTLPFLGRRRGWLFVSQCMLVGGFLWMGSLRPEQSLMWLVGAAVFTSFSSATQDILIDSYRRELLQDNQLGMGSSVYVLGYRFGMLTAGSLAPLLSDRISWGAVYYTMAGLMGVGLMTTIFSPEPTISGASPKTLKEAVIEPFLEYFRRPKALIILWFILLYKIGDAMASALLKPFYSEIGYSNTQIGAVVGPVGIWAMILGGLFGGVLLVKLSIQRALLGFGFLQALSTLAFGGLALWKFSEPSLLLLGAVIFFENFTSGMGTAAYAAFMASLTNKRFTATQYALLTSLMGVPMHIFGAYTGVLQTQLGWAGFFVFCTVIAIPGLVLLALFKKWGPVSSQA